VFDNDDRGISQIVEAGLEEILSGRASLDDIIRRNPTIAAELRPELEAALWLVSKREQVQTRPGYIAASKNRLTRRIKQEASRRGAKRAFLGFNWSFRIPALRWTAAIMIVMIFFSMSGGVVSAAQEAIPGQELYPVKRFSEQVVFDLTVDLVQKVELSSHFAERRLVEIEALIMRTEFALALKTVEDFQIQVKKTVELLEKIGDGNVIDKLALAERVNSDFIRRAERLQILIVGAPADLQVELVRARDMSTASATVAKDVSDTLKEKYHLATDTPQPTLTRTLAESTVEQPTLWITSTLVKSATPIVIVITPVPGSIDNDDDPMLTKTLGPDRRDIKPGLTKTPKPTNENRPPKDDKDPSKPPKDK
jgi:hypothetical protein